MKRYFAARGVLLEWVRWSRIPMVVAMLATIVVPAICSAKGPIVSASVDWWALFLAFMKGPIVS